MALVAGGGGGGKSTGIGIGGSLGGGFSMAKWREDEEEKKRKAAAAKLATEEQKIVANEKAQRRNFAQPTADPDADSALYRKRANEVQSTRSIWQPKDSDPLTNYWRLSQERTQENVAKRVSAIYWMWNTRIPDYNGSAVIQELISSPYTLDEIDNMIEQARGVFYDPSYKTLVGDEVWRKRSENVNRLQEELLQEYGYGGQPKSIANSQLWEAMEQTLKAQDEAEIPKGSVGTALTIASFAFGGGGPITVLGRGAIYNGVKPAIAKVLGFGAELTGIEKAAHAAASAGRFAAKANIGMKVIGGLATSLENERIAEIQRQGMAQERKVVEGGLPASPYGAEQNPMALMHSFSGDNQIAQTQKLVDNMQLMNQVPETHADIMEIQSKLIPAFKESGFDTSQLEATGYWDWSWIGVMVDAQISITRGYYAEQRLAIEEGDAPYWAPVNGDMTWTGTEPGVESTIASVDVNGKITMVPNPEASKVEGWPQWMAKRAARLAAREEMYNDNRALFEFWTTSGLPNNKLELEALANRFNENGPLQALYGSLLRIALLTGQTAEAGAAALNLQIRKWKDPYYQKLLEDACDYVDSQDFEPTTGFEKKPERSDYAFARMEIEAGALKDDEVAQEKWAAVKEYDHAMIDNGHYSAGFLEDMGLAVGMDYDRVVNYGKEHPDVVRAFDLGVWISLSGVNPIGRVRRAVFRGKVQSNIISWNKSRRSHQVINNIAKRLWEFDPQAAESYMRGSGANRAIQTNWLVKTNKSGKQTLSPQSRIVREVAEDVVDAVERGRPELVGTTILKGAPTEVIDMVVREAQKSPSKTGLTTAEVTGWIGADYMRGLQAQNLAKWIAKRQTKLWDVISKDVLAERLHKNIGQEYVKGADILPYLHDNRLAPPTRTYQSMLRWVGSIENDWLREFTTKWTIGQVTRGPVSEVEMSGLGSLDRIRDAAFAVSQDAAWAWRFANRWVGSRSEGQMKRLITEYETKFNQKWSGATDVLPDSGLQSAARAMGFETAETGAQALAPNPDLAFFNPKKPEYMTEYITTGSKGRPITKQALPDTVYAQYMMSLGRRALWAPYNPNNAATVLGKYILAGKNLLWRYPTSVAHQVSTPLRQWTVAMGAPLLFQKHAITDSSRTMLEEGPWVMAEAFGLKKLSVRGRTIVPQVRSSMKRRVDTILEGLPPSLRDEILYRKARSHSSEAQWLSGKRRFTYRPKTLRDRDTGRVIDMDGSVNALRRITEGKAFREWSRGGENAVRIWLKTAEGKEFLDKGWTQRAQNINAEYGVKVNKTQARALAADDYIQTMVTRNWEVLDRQMPNIMSLMKNQSVGNQLLDMKAIKKAIDDNPTENAVLSLPAHTMGDQSLPGYIVGLAMSPNKWNRDVMFDHVFLTQYKRMTKDGVTPENAARSAATIAELNVARVHFDLSNALAIEARHRWLAWFATKHRLYGTYILKTAMERPTMAAAAVTIRDWMEERNERMGVSEYDKYDLVFNWGGKQRRMNIAPIFWFSEYPLESSAMLAIEKGASTVIEEATGLQLHPSPQPFGLTFTRADSLFVTIADVMSSSKITTPEELQTWLKAQDSNKRLRWNRLINNMRAKELSQGREIDALEAFHMVREGAVWTEFQKSFKFYSGRTMDEGELEIERLTREFTETATQDQEKAMEMLRTNPLLSMALNASMDPVEKEQMDDGFRVYNKYFDDYIAKCESAADKGTEFLLTHYREYLDEFKANVDTIIDDQYVETYNPTFAARYKANNPTEFIEALGIVLPLLPEGSVYNSGRYPTEREITDYTEELKKILEEATKEYELLDTDSSVLLYQMLKNDNYDIPLADFKGESEYSLVPHKANNMARYLARGGETGIFIADTFLDLIEEQTKRKWISGGIGSNGKATLPFMAYLTDEQAELLGINRNPDVKKIWFEYAVYDWALKQWAKTQTTTDPKTGVTKGITTSMKVYQDKRAEIMDPLIAQWKQQSPDWAWEYEFSKKPLHERLLAAGTGTGTGKESEGMRDFLGIVSRMWDTFDVTYNTNSKEPGITSGAGTARNIVIDATKEVYELTKSNPQWWEMFRDTYPLSKFGFNTAWRLTDEADPHKYDFLYEREPTVDEEAEEEWWYSGEEGN